MRYRRKTIVVLVVAALVALAVGYAFWDGARPVSASDAWIPAFAGMTWVCAGMTWVCAGMTWVCAGMTWIAVLDKAAMRA